MATPSLKQEEGKPGIITRIIGFVLTVAVVTSLTLTPFALAYVLAPSFVLEVLSFPFPVLLPLALVYVVLMTVIGLRIAWIFGCGPWGRLTAKRQRDEM